MRGSAFRTALAVAALAVATTGCGGHADPAVQESSFGSGADRIWVFQPPGKASSLVLFVHGQGDVKETTPFYHRPWLRHLARAGSIVLYPRFELSPGAPGAIGHVAAGLRAAAAHVDIRGLPTVAIGYSRGGWLVFPSALRAAREGLNIRAILSVFPVTPEAPIDLRQLPAGTTIDVLAGDRDRVVGNIGAAQVLALLAYQRYPQRLTTARLVRSHGAFVASHLSVLETSPGARAAYWARADRLLARVRSRSARS